MSLNGTNGSAIQGKTFPIVMVTPEQELGEKRRALVVMHDMLEQLRKENAELARKAHKAEAECGVLTADAVVLKRQVEELSTTAKSQEEALEYARRNIDKLRDRYSDAFNRAETLRKGLRSEVERREELQRELDSVMPDFFRYRRIPRVVRMFFRVVFRLRNAGQNVFAPLKEE